MQTKALTPQGTANKGAQEQSNNQKQTWFAAEPAATVNLTSFEVV